MKGIKKKNRERESCVWIESKDVSEKKSANVRMKEGGRK